MGDLESVKDPRNGEALTSGAISVILKGKGQRAQILHTPFFTLQKRAGLASSPPEIWDVAKFTPQRARCNNPDYYHESLTLHGLLFVLNALVIRILLLECSSLYEERVGATLSNHSPASPSLLFPSATSALNSPASTHQVHVSQSSTVIWLYKLLTRR